MYEQYSLNCGRSKECDLALTGCNDGQPDRHASIANIVSDKSNENEDCTVHYNNWQVVDECFELEAKYKITDYLGAGAYGVVCAALDCQNNRAVAIKKCKRIFQSRTMAKRTLREMRILRLLHHSNVIKFIF